MAPVNSGRTRLCRLPVFRRLAPLIISAILPHTALCRSAGAQVSRPVPAASKVASVQFSGSSRFAGDVLARSIGLTPGRLVTRGDIESAADRLAKLGWFGEVHYKFDSSTKGVEIQFSLQDAPCHPMWFDNFPWFTDSEIEDALRASGMPYNGTAPESGIGLDTFREAIAGLLKARNIPGEVDGELVEAPGSDEMVERFRVIGAKVTVTGLTFSDELAENDLVIKQVEDEIVGKAFSRYTLAIFVVEHVRPEYTSRGYLHVRFGDPVPQFVGEPTRPLSNEIVVQLPVEPGPQYHWGGIEWSGQLALDAPALNALLGFVEGETASDLKLQAGWDAITKEYAKRGYLEAKIQSAAQFDDAKGLVSYSGRVIEGIQYRMGRLVLAGLSLSAERQLLSNWKLARGDIFDNSYFEDFLNGGAEKIFKNSPVHFEHIEHLLKPDPQTKTVDVLLNFR